MPQSDDLDVIEKQIAKIMTGLFFRYIRPENDRYRTTETDLLSFEKKLGRRLPSDYRVFLLHYGITEFANHVTFPTPGAPGGDADWLSTFSGCAPGDAYDVQQRWEWSC